MLSESVAKALCLLGGPEVEETARFCSMFDKFFDAPNVGKFSSGKQNRKAFQAPYRSASDFRLKVRTKYHLVGRSHGFNICMYSVEFIQYLDNWEESVDKRPGIPKKGRNKAKKKMLLSAQTLLGLRMTGKQHINAHLSMIISFYSCYSFLCWHLWI